VVTPDPEVIERANRLGDRVNGHPEFIETVVPELRTMLGQVSEPAELEAVIDALGLAWCEEASLAVIPFANHPEASVRLASVQALPGGVESAEAVDLVVAALLPRCSDDDDDVRDWATFGIGVQLDRDTPEIRSVLKERVSDPNEDVRLEAICGLAKRRDSVAVPLVLEILQEDWVPWPFIEAARDLADPRLVDALEELLTRWDGNLDDLREALAACKGERITY